MLVDLRPPVAVQSLDHKDCSFAGRKPGDEEFFGFEPHLKQDFLDQNQSPNRPCAHEGQPVEMRADASVRPALGGVS